MDSEIDLENLPKHIAIIMDGNRRWAKKKGMPAKVGHSEGAKTLEKIAKYCNKIGIKVLTVYAFSTENWKRSKEEVDALMELLEKYIKDFDKNMSADNIRIKSIGDMSRLNENLQKGIKRVEENTKHNTGMLFNIAINYGGREEIVRATKNICNDVLNNTISINDIKENTIDKYLYTANEISNVDLMIRTSGEIRISNFLLWQLAYSEMIFVEKNWPDFNEKDIDCCIEEYVKRNRKFGGN